jgi:Rod binding domain-containing protein
MEIHSSHPSVQLSKNQTDLMTAARELEATFVAEMLKAARFGEHGTGAEGGIGAQHFNSFLIEAQARQIVTHYDFGLRHSILSSLQKGHSE